MTPEKLEKFYIETLNEMSLQLGEEIENVNQLLLENEELRKALKMLVDEKVEYMKLNHLGDPEAQHTIKVARSLLDAE